MSCKYKEDKDLAFLRYADNEMLDILVKHLTLDKDGKKRKSESLIGNKDFIEANGDYRKVWQLIGAEIQHYGGDTIEHLAKLIANPFVDNLSPL
ncbi:DUF3944 domain-containing protein [Marinomonas sp. IMCC 4694]|uniref:DUF3944 domain-containing protein n=1 Tax=Marinomonas sp. IMCC 4694 TaxID=2605432 RepID=UPI0011E827A5|nr:DUF3944 domain-containing protein [Marinomonas sp. IMCC 4694]TYL47319.1 DUF3944 domain-containing protein [Marinomonas sp. IMCC 4694]